MGGGKDKIRAVKGMNDLFEESLSSWRHVEATAQRVFAKFGYGEIRTPVLEDVQLFVRGVGEMTDIVEKEMYVFEDRDGKHLCLRPENTAGVVRALMQHGKIIPDAELKTFYIGPMFRRERPQKGRYRQFHQLGVEALGLSEPEIDVEVMAMLAHFLEELGLSGVKLVINSLGAGDERQAYSGLLQSFFSEHRDELCSDCQRRLDKNPLRILDCKVKTDQALAANAPTTVEALGDASRAHFEAVQEGMTRLGVAYEVAPRLVRGLDYYTRTVFEALADTGLGAQNAVAAGGRYDGLVQQLGGKATPAVGFAAGIERLILLLQDAGRGVEKRGPDLSLVGADDVGRKSTFALAHALRRLDLSVDQDLRGRSVKSQMRRADKAAARAVLVLGADEVEKGEANLKILATGDVKTVRLEAGAIKQVLES
jgi:histidyl-tRNA synthetase